MKKCPFCAEEIQDAAIKCEHCGELVEKDAQAPPQLVKGKEIASKTQPEDTAPAKSSIRRPALPLQISDITKADMAIKSAWIAGIVCGVTTVILSLSNLLGLNEWNLLDAVFIFGLSFGVYKKNRVCAVMLFIYFIGAKVLQIYEGDPLTSARQGVIFGIIFGYLFFQGIRGTFAYHKLAKEEQRREVPSGPKSFTASDEIPEIVTSKPESKLPAEKDNISVSKQKIGYSNTTVITVVGLAILIVIGIGIVVYNSNQDNRVGYAPIAVNPERTPAPEAKPKEGWLDRASALVKAQDWQGLLAWGLRWTQAEPDNAVAWAGLGYAYGKLGRYPEAIEACRKALRLNPDFPEAWNNLGMAYRELGRYQDAIDAFQEALRLKPNAADAWNELGVSYVKLGRYSEAIKAYRKGLRLKPDYAEVFWYNLGVAYGGLGRYQDAIDAFQEALRLKPDFPEAWNDLGTAYEDLGRYRDAITAYRKGLRLKPDDKDAWYNLGLTYAKSGNRSAALEAVKELRRYDPQKADELFNLIMKP